MMFENGDISNVANVCWHRVPNQQTSH